MTRRGESRPCQSLCDKFARARKITVDTGLTIDEARSACEAYNNNRTPAQIRKGTKMEFEQEHRRRRR